MQQIDLKSLYVYYFFKNSIFACSGSWVLELLFLSFSFFFLAHSLFESCNFHKCCRVGQPKAVGFGDFFLYILISLFVVEYLLLAAKLNVKFLMATDCYRFIHLFFLMESLKWKNFELLII